MNVPKTWRAENIGGRVGILEVYRDGSVGGWAFDRRDPGTRVALDLYVDGGKIATFEASRLREDLERAGSFGDGRCGFLYTIDEGFSGEREIDVRFAGTGVSVQNAPVSVEGQWQPAHAFWKPKRPAAALVGRDGWLYLCLDSYGALEQHAGRRGLKPEDLALYAEVFTRRGAYYRQRGIPYICAISPGKETIYPEYLPEALRLPVAATPLDQVLAHLRPHAPIDMRPALLAVKGGGHPLYHRQDSHWNDLGAYWGYRILLDAARGCGLAVGDPLPLAAFDLVTRPSTSGDLLGKTLMRLENDGYQPLTDQTPPDPEPVPRLVPKSPLRACKLPVPEHLKVSKTRATLVLETGDANLPTAVVFRGSSGDWIVPFLSEHFRRIVYVWENRTNEAVLDAERPDVVFHLFTERFLMAKPEF